MKTLIQILRHPRKFDGIMCLPMRFDAAETLLEHWNELGSKDQSLVCQVLLFSGRYK